MDNGNGLCQVTISIGEDVREQNRLLNTMDDDFDSSKGLLMSTMKRLGIHLALGQLPEYADSRLPSEIITT
ncbi:hypothetical protein ANCCAN_27783 [Ancylostoma caninum]|uniref:t-SNARE coiled-coil homology domain-containing protein n=1 Tax=Ancylostoma caninum TaxID=29170 RepID=A0A368F691_ANCCA|nr:hypothetical protein ANCCAN_27783 [Ancylostoma caninum]